MKKTCKRILALLLALSILFMLGCTQTPETQPSTEDFSDIPEGYNQLVLYWDYSDNISTAAFWIWPEGGNGEGYPVEADAYG